MALDRKEIKLVAIDVDGTLLNSEHEMTPRIEKALRAAAEQGVMVVFATGKTRNAVVPHLTKLGIDAPGIYNQGLIAVDADGKPIHSQTLEPRIARQVITMAEDRGFSVLAYAGSRILSKTRNRHIEDILAQYHEVIPEVVGALQNILIDTPIQKLLAVGDPHAIKGLRWQLSALVGGHGRLVQAAVPEMLEILPPNGSKGAALKVVCKHFKIAPEQVVAIGDAENDIEMIQFAGVGVAMGNADQKTKDAANHVVASNDEDGVAEALERFVLKPKAAVTVEKPEAKQGDAKAAAATPEPPKADQQEGKN
jgi:Cof subfamily protein (haloacid dehalogenase superfamily)